MVGHRMNAKPNRLASLANRAILKALSATLFTAALITIIITLLETPYKNPNQPTFFLLSMIAAAPIIFFWVWRQHRLEHANGRLRRLAYNDVLLDCLNRRGFTVSAERALRTASIQRPCALLVIDVDNFKRVNDSYGHLEGDNALRIIANIIRSSVRTTDLFGRIGGEEFGVILTGTDADRARMIASRIREAVAAASFVPEGAAYPLSVSIGGTVADTPTSFVELFASADKHLFAAKKLGRNRVAFTSPDAAANKSVNTAA